jgi:hypothetical protein
MYRNEGFSSLYRGVIINAFAGSLANSIFFYVYSDGKNRYGFDQSKPYSWQTLFISYRAGLASMAVTTPFWTVKTRLSLYQEQTKVRSDYIMRQVVTEMYQKEGLVSFYRGFVPSIFMSTYGVI